MDVDGDASFACMFLWCVLAGEVDKSIYISVHFNQLDGLTDRTLWVVWGNMVTLVSKSSKSDWCAGSAGINLSKAWQRRAHGGDGNTQRATVTIYAVPFATLLSCNFMGDVILFSYYYNISCFRRICFIFDVFVIPLDFIFPAFHSFPPWASLHRFHVATLQNN